MKTIQFHIETGMLAAVLEGRKTQTVRSLSNQGKYHVGDILAVVEPYYLDYWGEPNFDMNFFKGDWAGEELGDPDKFPVDLARNFVKITGIAVKKPRSFDEDECRKEGINYRLEPDSEKYPDDFVACYYDYEENDFGYGYNPRGSFKSLLQAIYGIERGAQLFESEMLVLTFVLCDRDGKEVGK